MTKETIGGFHEQLPNRHKIGDIFLDTLVNLELSGADSLEHIRYLHSRGDKLLMMGNHRSNADAPVLGHTLEQNGFADLSNNIVFLLGQRLKASPGTNFFSMAYSHIDVWPPTMEIETEEERKKAFAMTKESLRAVREQLSHGKIVTVFPEGTRTRNGDMGSFNPQVARYAQGENVYVIPFALAGTENVWPVNQVVPSFQHNTARLSIGAPILVEDHLNGNGRECNQRFMDYTQNIVGELYEGIS